MTQDQIINEIKNIEKKFNELTRSEITDQFMDLALKYNSTNKNNDIEFTTALKNLASEFIEAKLNSQAKPIRGYKYLELKKQ